MKRIFLYSCFSLFSYVSIAQSSEQTTDRITAGKKSTAGFNGTTVPFNNNFTVEKNNPATAVKNQQRTNTCWSFSGTAVIESQLLKNNIGNFDLSEMFTVRNIYFEKARNYILRQGKAQFGEGGLGHDVVRSISQYGAMPEASYTGLKNGENSYDYISMELRLKVYLDSSIRANNRLKSSANISENWMDGFVKILNENMGVPPAEFVYNGKRYTPLTFAKDVLRFNADDFVSLTSFTHHPYYAPFILEVPDNFSNGMYYNLPLKEMIELVKTTIRNGYTVMWDADVTNPGFQPKLGLAMSTDSAAIISNDMSLDISENRWDEKIRQHLFETLVTQDDHLMQITGLGKTKAGKSFFIVKNSYGSIGPLSGYLEVSESYFATNTISLLVPKAALSKALLDKLKVN